MQEDWKSTLALFGCIALMVIAMAGCEALRCYCEAKVTINKQNIEESK